ncbi:hypothetical protein IEE83_27900 [Dyadobacter sp. UP-52]|uniref:Uncharacterized protein n=1 Tax=Dyadobacter subterraneus TaxID=2773304 RepID=A0ABR9WJN5_9BACT|nr:hypothetical protein [Dyadobacter subterraneus]
MNVQNILVAVGDRLSAVGLQPLKFQFFHQFDSRLPKADSPFEQTQSLICYQKENILF